MRMRVNTNVIPLLVRVEVNLTMRDKSHCEQIGNLYDVYVYFARTN